MLFERAANLVLTFAVVCRRQSFNDLRTIGYKAWIEDTNGNVIEETVLKNAIK